jgi:hypothetical protein
MSPWSLSHLHYHIHSWSSKSSIVLYFCFKTPNVIYCTFFSTLKTIIGLLFENKNYQNYFSITLALSNMKRKEKLVNISPNLCNLLLK